MQEILFAKSATFWGKEYFAANGILQETSNFM